MWDMQNGMGCGYFIILFIIMIVSCHILTDNCEHNYLRSKGLNDHTYCENGVRMSQGTRRPIYNPDGSLLTCEQLRNRITEYCIENPD
jgi:hypothetical protein